MPRTSRTSHAPQALQAHGETETGRTNPDVTAVARDLVASFGHDPDRYVPGTVAVLPGTRTTTWDLACSPECPHDDTRCHRPHAAYLGDDTVRARLVPEQRRGA